MTAPFTPHPCLPLPTRAEIDAIIARHGSGAVEVFQEIERKRQRAIRDATDRSRELAG